MKCICPKPEPCCPIPKLLYNGNSVFGYFRPLARKYCKLLWGARSPGSWAPKLLNSTKPGGPNRKHGIYSLTALKQKKAPIPPTLSPPESRPASKTHPPTHHPTPLPKQERIVGHIYACVHKYVICSFVFLCIPVCQTIYTKKRCIGHATGRDGPR